MSRCKLCDANSMGLSMFRPEGSHRSHFKELPNGDILCDECYTWDGEVMSDFHDQDLEEEENQDAFEYDGNTE